MNQSTTINLELGSKEEVIGSMKESLTIISIAVLDVFMYCIMAFTLMLLWGWFIVDIFNVNKLTFIQSLGLTLFISYACYQPDKETDLNFLYIKYCKTMFCSVFVLVVGYFVQLIAGVV